MVTSEDYKSLYGKDDVRKQLKDDQHCKCAYCEKTLIDEPKHVEHYRPKSRYPDLAFTWDNLLGSCWACNIKKWNNFPLEDESKRYTSQEVPLLINPYNDDPADYIEFHEEEARPKSGLTGIMRQKAETTMEMLLKRPDLVYRRRCAWRKYKDFLLAVSHIRRDSIDYGRFQNLINEYMVDEHEFAGMFRYQRP